jgi:hypothetical protein
METSALAFSSRIIKFWINFEPVGTVNFSVQDDGSLALICHWPVFNHVIIWSIHFIPLARPGRQMARPPIPGIF